MALSRIAHMNKHFDHFSDLADIELDNVGLNHEKNHDINPADFPVVRFINKIILDAIRKRASDIHFEPYENIYRIRLRIDGILYQVAEPGAHLAPRLSTRLKIMAGLDISERRIPQDGRFTLNFTAEKTISFRVSTCPTLLGEKIVLRILDSHNMKLDITELGFNEAQKKLFLDAIHRPQGMILVTGPTGSGKTVTLYTALSLLNSVQKNISTAEDPVEIHLPGINQVHINTKTGLTFSTALRAFLRQDPDIIMVGEIRDQETAEISIKAAQTGHLVLSTLHTNSAEATLTRLKNMGVESFNMTDSLNLIIAQRLVRRLCEHCKGAHCAECQQGYKGRVGVFEFLPFNKDFKKEDFIPLYQDGLDKVKNGITTMEEINCLQ